MNKADLFSKVATKAEISKKEAEKAVTAVLASIEEALIKLKKYTGDILKATDNFSIVSTVGDLAYHRLCGCSSYIQP